ncbi:hypothetical protein MRQ36_16700 [Micromonospora sp. R77]|uniref:hypothetical protein n=1 Tax=Micromonospora sp. R77 TaxID=2925836 RepID=UPI001F5FFAA7|nr:hypothetical protein [Micromonospora sp. R77]MCI4064149.1 hypothetical protein [Micromonospora sp. R77]
MSWQAVSSIIGAFGALAAAGSLYAAFELYRRRIHDERATRFKADITNLMGKFSRLQTAISFTYPDEVAHDTVKSERLDSFFVNLYGSESQEEFFERARQIGTSISIPAAVHAKTYESYYDSLIEINQLASGHRADHPGLYLALSTVNYGFGFVIDRYVIAARDSEKWGEPLVRLWPVKQYSDAWGMRVAFGKFLTEQLLRRQQYCNALLTTLNDVSKIVTEAYLQLTPKDLARQRRRESKVKLSNYEGASLMCLRLSQSKRAIADVLSPEQSASYDACLSIIAGLDSPPAAQAGGFY